MHTMLMRSRAFTLAELLIALVILGVIATFTIPKVLQSQQSSKYNAIGKEAMSMISGAYQAYKQQQTASSSTKTSDLTPYLNYVSVDTTTLIDYPLGSTVSCGGGGSLCLNLHNGAKLLFYSMSFGNTASTNALWFNVDPDGQSGGPTNGPAGLEFALYYTGRLTSWPGIDTNTCSSDTCRNPDQTKIPSWFSWN